MDISICKTEYTTKYSWTTESFNERTGNMCKDFAFNHHQCIDFIGEVKNNG